jgi:hypothetical protein
VGMAQALNEDVAWHSPACFQVAANIARDILTGPGAAAGEQLLYEQRAEWNAIRQDLRSTASAAGTIPVRNHPDRQRRGPYHTPVRRQRRPRRPRAITVPLPAKPHRAHRSVPEMPLTAQSRPLAGAVPRSRRLVAQGPGSTRTTS